MVFSKSLLFFIEEYSIHVWQLRLNDLGYKLNKDNSLNELN